MMNFWKQTTHVMSYFKDENFRGDKRLPSSFMSGFLEVGCFAYPSRVLGY
jgi:NADH dehydrogenase (ubiquinone) 1 alpha subcomplex subunit 6